MKPGNVLVMTVGEYLDKHAGEAAWFATSRYPDDSRHLGVAFFPICRGEKKPRYLPSGERFNEVNDPASGSDVMEFWDWNTGARLITHRDNVALVLIR